MENPAVGVHNLRFYANDSAGNWNTSVTASYMVVPTSNVTGGRIAFLCRTGSCDYNTEDEIIEWLEEQGWGVTGKKYNNWESDELDEYDLIACSDQSYACDIRFGSAAYNKHVNGGKPFIEFSDRRSAKAGYRFGYVKSSYGSTGPESINLFVTAGDVVTAGYFADTPVFLTPQETGVIPDSKLKSMVRDIADSDYDNGKSALFKVEKGLHGRYVWVGWFNGYTFWGRFSGTLPSDLNSNGSDILRKAVSWAQCGDVFGCKQPCPHECCTGDGYAKKDCPEGYGCVNNQCVQGACTEGDKRCSDSRLEECVNGAWTEVEDCVWGCENGACNPPMSWLECYRECRHRGNYIEAVSYTHLTLPTKA